MKQAAVRTLTVIALVSIFLSGCAYQLQLHSRVAGQPGGTGVANSGDKSMTVSVGNRVFKGTYVFDGGSVVPTNSFGSATAYSRYGTTTVHGSSFGTMVVPGSNRGQSFLTSIDGTTMRCQFFYKDSSGMGECQTNTSEVYDLVIGSPR